MDSTAPIFLEPLSTGLLFLKCFTLNYLCLLQIISTVRFSRMSVVDHLLKVSKGPHTWVSLSYKLSFLWLEAERNEEWNFEIFLRDTTPLQEAAKYSGWGPRGHVGLSCEPTLGMCAWVMEGYLSPQIFVQVHCSLPLCLCGCGQRLPLSQCSYMPGTSS